MTLTGLEIKKRIQAGGIVIEPFTPSQVQPNSYDIRLSEHMAILSLNKGEFIDVKTPLPIEDVAFTSDGYVLEPGRLYLATTLEYFVMGNTVGVVHGKSSLARLGLTIHTAGFIDSGFSGYITLELSCIHRIKLYPGMAIGQVQFADCAGEYVPYAGKYINRDPKPQASGVWRNFNK